MGGKQKPYEMWQAGNSLAASTLANSSRASPARNMAAPPPFARSRIPPATQANNGMQGYKKVYKEFQWITGVFKGLQRITRVYKGLLGITRDYKGLLGIT